MVALLWLDRRVWPGIAVAAFLVNLPISSSPMAAVGIAMGNTLAPLFAHFLLQRVRFQPRLERLRDALAIVFLGALGGMLVSATVGATTPSSQGRAGTHPLEDAIRLFPFLRDQYQTLLVPDAEKADHNRATDGAYAVAEDVGGVRVLLVDDTLTTGARAQSAASSLQLAGANVVAMVPVGRVIKPDFSAETAELLGRAREQPFSFDTCCLES